MKEKIKLYGSIFIMIICIPYLITVYTKGSIWLSSSRGIMDEQSEEKLLGILASEIPIDYDMECLKAQAVITRTNQQSGSEEVGWTEEEMKLQWGVNYEQNRQKLLKAITDTKGQILTYEGEPILAAFHVACNGKTRDAADIPGQEEYHYLKSVPSKDDILADGFLCVSFMEKEEMIQALKELFPEEEMEAETILETFQIMERDKAEYVTKMQYKDTVVNGEAVRTVLGLDSACFYLSELNGGIRIVTKGIGHGLGFSQYGAQQLSKQGYHYKDLLLYYYHDVKLEKLK